MKTLSEIKKERNKIKSLIQAELLTIIQENDSDASQPLTIKEMQNILGVSSPSVVMHHIKQLVKKGYIVKDHQRKYHPVNIFGKPGKVIKVHDPIAEALSQIKTSLEKQTALLEKILREKE